MCTRYWTEESPELRPIVEEMRRSSLVSKWQNTTSVKAYGEMRPTDVVPVIAPDRTGSRSVFPMRWGYSGRSLLVNARSETAAEKPAFREDWKKHRCIVPASWYFEWQHITGNEGQESFGEDFAAELTGGISPVLKRRYRIQPRGSVMTWLCGLYRIENGLPVFVILTREPGEEIRFIHDRMPLILPERYIDDWIRPDAKPEEFLDKALTEMVFERG